MQGLSGKLSKLIPIKVNILEFFRPYALQEGETLYLFYEQYHASQLFRESSIMLRKASIRGTENSELPKILTDK